MSAPNGAAPSTETLLARAYDLCNEQAARIDRTLDYLHELADGPLQPTVRLVVESVERSLTTPTASADASGQP